MPSLFLLSSSVRSQLDFYSEPQWIDFQKNLCHAKLQSMQTNPKSGKIYFANMVRFVAKTSPLTGLAAFEKQKITSIGFDKPPESMTTRYEAVKKQRVMAFNEEAFQNIKSKREKVHKKKLKFGDIVEQVRKDRDSFVMRGVVSHELVKGESAGL